MASIALKNAEKWFGSERVINGVNLTIEKGEFVVFVGPSGCGKSTLLRMIAGLEETSRGQIIVDDRDATAEPPYQRGLAMVFQSYALYPHMSVRDNMGFSLKSAGLPKKEVAEKVDSAARILKLEALMERRPKDLSGGQRQRVAIGRSIVREPTAFLFDEPLSNLDAALRVEMRYEIAKLHQTLKSTMIYVTHDQVEAMTLADRIVVLDAGHIAQVGRPRDLYENPSNLFVAQFIGSPQMNIIEASATGLRFAAPTEAKHLGIRPEHISVSAAGTGHADGVVDVIEYLGSDTFVILECSGLGRLTVRLAEDAQIELGEQCGISFQTERIHFFDQEGKSLSKN